MVIPSEDRPGGVRFTGIPASNHWTSEIGAIHVCAYLFLPRPIITDSKEGELESVMHPRLPYWVYFISS